VSGELGAGPDGSSRRMRVAEVFDGRGPTGGVVINRPQVEPMEMAALTAYLTKAPVALATTKTGEDEMAPGAGLVVPRAYHTDGEWIWPAAVGYYLHRYRLPPQNELLAHIRARGFQVGTVSEERRQAAAAQMLEELAAAKRGPAAGPSLDGPALNGTAASREPGPGTSGASPNVWSTGTWAPAVPASAAPTPGPVTEPELLSSGAWTPSVPVPAPEPVSSGAWTPTAQEQEPESEPVPNGTWAPSVPAQASGPVSSGNWAPSVAEQASEPEPVASGNWTPSVLAAAAPVPEPEPVVAAAVNAAPPLVGPTPPAPAVEPAEPSLWLPAPAGEPVIESVPESVPAPAVEPAVESAFVKIEPEEPGESEGFSPAFTAAGNRHAAWVYEQIETLLAFMPVDEWSVDHATGRYRQAGREFTVDALGRLGQDGRWTWAWAEPEAWSPNPVLTEHSRRLRDQGDRLGIRELMEPVLDLAGIADAEDPETAAEMLAWTAMGIAGARGYIGHAFSDENRLYYLAFDESIPVARPDLDAAAHYLTQGVDKFEEDPSDCVIGYVEYHGWDWSRSAEGLVVSAPGLGAFTVILAGDGSLTGVRRHG
jgi:hypothetical protein